MKHFNSKLLISLLLFMCATITFAHDFAVANSDGKTIYYKYNSYGSSVSVTYAGTSYDNVFNEYSGEIVIPETVTYSGKTYSVTSIGSYAFEDCSDLASVTIPESVTSIGNGVFSSCSRLTEIKVADGNNVYDSRNNCNAIINTSSNTLIAGCKNTIIPNSVTSIGSYAFEDCWNLTSVTIPNSVTSIGSSAFSGCSGLTSVTIPNSVTSIGEMAFYFCISLTSVTIPNSVTTISSYAFYDCHGLTSVTIIPNSVTSIGSSAFSGCSGLKKVIVLNIDIKNWCSITFGSSSANPLSFAHHLYSDENTEITKLVI